MKQRNTLGRRRFLALGASAVALHVARPWSIIQPASAQTAYDFYISPTGSDSNPGTLSQPWAISALNTKRSLYAGKRVGLLDGTYRLFGYGSTYYADPKLVVAGGVSANAPTVVEAVNPRKAIITGRAADGRLESATTGPLMGCSDSYVQFRNLRFERHSGSALLMTRVYAQTGIHDRFGWVVEGCDFYDTHNLGAAGGGNAAALKMYQANQAIVRNCRFERMRESLDVGNFSDTKAGSGYQTYDCSSCIVEYCTFIDCKGVYHKEASQKGSPIVRYCYFDPLKNNANLSNSDCIQIDSTETNLAHSITVHNNILLGEGNFRGESRPVWNIPMHFYNNTVFMRTRAYFGAHAGFSTDNPRLTNIHRNIFWRTLSAGFGDVYITDQSWSTLDWNSYPTSNFNLRTLNVNAVGSAGFKQTFTSLSAWKLHTQKDSNAFQANPLFVNGSGHTSESFQLQSGSPCILAQVPGGQIGAWGDNARQIGANFSSSGSAAPAAPAITNVS